MLWAMESLERSVYATVAYYSALRWPLSIAELTERLIPPVRFGGAVSAPMMGEVASVLDGLLVSGALTSADGLIWTPEFPGEPVRQRVTRHAACAQAWQRMLPSAWWLQAVPYVRALAASGSLALGNTGPQSDWDMFVIAQAGRLYTARAFLLLTAALMGRLRTKRQRVAPGKFCFNHYITTGGLSIRHRSLFVAHALAWLVPVYDPEGYLPRLWQANQWMSDFVMRFGGSTFERRSARPARILGAVKWTTEFILNTFVGSALEYLLRTLQQRRILRDPATYAAGGRVVADNRELEFHPRSFEATALARYRVALARVGMKRYAEHDSGLTRG